MKSVFLILSISLLIKSAFTQDSIPHISGKVNISINEGTFECDITLSNCPKIEDYVIRINSGMNVKWIKNPLALYESLQYEKSDNDSNATGETNGYYLPKFGKDKKYLPKSIRINYVGKYPVITDTSSYVDWRGNLAFNGSSIRADGLQSAWLPILYDLKNDKRFNNVTYDLDISCNDCKVIYLNGNDPVIGSKATLSSTKPNELTLFAGNYSFEKINQTYFLNPDAILDELSKFESIQSSFQKYLEQKISIPFKGKTFYIQTSPVSKRNSWLYASYPAIVNISLKSGMKDMVDTVKSKNFREYIAHELGHYYFGTIRSFNSPLSGFITEGFAEFLSLKITKDKISEQQYLMKLNSYYSTIKNFTPTPISQINSNKSYQNYDRYVYSYAPFILAAIESEIGEDKMMKWIQTLLKTPTTLTDYSFFIKTLEKVLNSPSQLDSIKSNYFLSSKSTENAATKLGISTHEKTPLASNIDSVTTTFYFFMIDPVINRGTSENQVYVYTPVLKFTGTNEELKAQIKKQFKILTDECENEGGCGSTVNTYYTREHAERVLKQILESTKKKFNYIIKERKLTE